MKARDSEI